jgi:hypothetical protein
VSSKRSKRRERNGYKKTHSALQIGRRERERERKEEEKERKSKEIGNCLPRTRYARGPFPRPKTLSPKKTRKQEEKKKNSLSGALENSVRKFEPKRSSSAT